MYGILSFELKYLEVSTIFKIFRCILNRPVSTINKMKFSTKLVDKFTVKAYLTVLNVVLLNEKQVSHRNFFRYLATGFCCIT